MIMALEVQKAYASVTNVFTSEYSLNQNNLIFNPTTHPSDCTSTDCI